MKEKNFDYYNARIRHAQQILELETLEEFVRYAQANHIRQIIRSSDIENGTPVFALTSKGALYTCGASGFKNLEDYQQSAVNGFPDAESFYSALDKNCATFGEYQLVLNTGITEGNVFEKIKSRGFVEGYAKLDAARKQNPMLPQLDEIQNAKELSDYADAKQFTDFTHFFKAWEAGFTDPFVHTAALDHGFSNADDFGIYKSGGFYTLEEFKIAKPVNIKNRAELSIYNVLQTQNFKDALFDERLVLSVLSKLDNNSKTEFSKLYDYFLKCEDEYRQLGPEPERKFYKWYTKRLRSRQDVKDFLAKSPHVKHFGTLDADSEIFETIPINRRKVVVDASNVAHNSNMADRRNALYKAQLKNVLLLVKKLKDDYGFEDIQVIADANLLSKVKDRELLKDIKALCRFSEMPGGVPADLFLIDTVKKHHCLLVTNDTFADWKLSDRWTEDNIDFYRLKFMLNENLVVLPHMERFEKK